MYFRFVDDVIFARNRPGKGVENKADITIGITPRLILILTYQGPHHPWEESAIYNCSVYFLHTNYSVQCNY